jgi:hypothetical protein
LREFIPRRARNSTFSRLSFSITLACSVNKDRKEATSWASSSQQGASALVGGGSTGNPTIRASNPQVVEGPVRGPDQLPPEIPIAIVDEFAIPGVGSADLVGVNSSGDITIVECKLHSNPEIRREVVGQLMAYASGLWRMTYDNFATIFEQRA